jgi:hypothetical protein
VAQAPLHADVDPNVAHEYALTRVNFRDPAESKLVIRMGIDQDHRTAGSGVDCSRYSHDFEDELGVDKS